MTPTPPILPDTELAGPIADLLRIAADALARLSAPPQADALRGDGVLLGCPFCGGEAICFESGCHENLWKVCCIKNCGFDGMVSVKGGKEASIAAWNRRAPTPPVSVREAAVMLLDAFTGRAPELPDAAFDAAQAAHGEGNAGEANDCIEAFLRALAAPSGKGGG